MAANIGLFYRSHFKE